MDLLGPFLFSQDMAPTTPSSIPDEVRSGDSWVFQVNLATYPGSEGWSLAVRFAGAKELAALASEITADGDGWLVNMPPASTTGLPPGLYRWAYVMTGSGTYAGQTYTAATGWVNVLGEISAEAAGSGRHITEEHLELVQGQLTKRYGEDVTSYTAGQMQVYREQVATLEATRDRLVRRLWKLRNPGRAGPTVGIRFG